MPLSPANAPAPTDTARPRTLHQPFVHDLAGVFHAPVQAWAQREGSITGHGAEGIYLADTRIASDLRCIPEEGELSPLGTQVLSAREVIFRDVVSLADGVVDPILTLERTRTADADGVAERLRLLSNDDRPRHLRLRFTLITDGASMSAVKDPRLLAAAGEVRPDATLSDGAAHWPIGAQGGEAVLALTGESTGLQADGPVVTWSVDLRAPAGGQAEASWRLQLSDPAAPFSPAREPWEGMEMAGEAGAAAPTGAGRAGAAASDGARQAGAAASAWTDDAAAATRLLARSLTDLDALRLQVPGAPDQTFFAAGAPWFFTLFGRDSLIAASLALPVDRGIAEGTLRTLALRQGTKVDVATAQQPGKILHEVRAQGMEMADSHLPPVYYGTIDATALWIELLHEARAAGLGEDVLRDLHPHLVAAARWLLEHADADGDGLLEYIDESGHGLANQGWKDSGDSIRFSDGRLAEGTIALAEVQGYAYAAALHAADLLESCDVLAGLGASAGNGGAAAPSSALPQQLRDWARALHTAFHEKFWLRDELGPFIALALDGEKRPVDGVASNMGHLLGTGLLDADQERIVVNRLLHPTMFSGYGIRTLSTTNGGYGPLRYHGGSVWTHDTGFILRGMLRSGFQQEAAEVARGLLRAAEGFDLRLPELFSGQGTSEVAPPLPYPASCRPQAWAAASAVPVAQALGAL